MGHDLTGRRNQPLSLIHTPTLDLGLGISEDSIKICVEMAVSFVSCVSPAMLAHLWSSHSCNGPCWQIETARVGNSIISPSLQWLPLGIIGLHKGKIAHYKLHALVLHFFLPPLHVFLRDGQHIPQLGGGIEADT